MIQDPNLIYKLDVDKDSSCYIKDGMSGLERKTKRLIDLFTAVICLAVFSPLFLICFIVVVHRTFRAALLYLQVPVYADGCRRRRTGTL